MPADAAPTAPEPSADARPGATVGGVAPSVPTPRPAPPVESTDDATPADAAPPDDETAAAPAAPPAGLTTRERAILAFEQQWWRHAGAKEQAVRDTFGVSSTRYYQLLNGLLDNPAALAADPVLIGRLRRLRSSRARNRRR
ncbi:DUF3263 domain-containing protein [Micromonospora sp. NPDC005237]|uniref:DUF3263 domain-containing protein n=1 Tax=Micromonospora sp. NPDC005237 TaxID=3155113 RepID=UPI0033A28C92